LARSIHLVDTIQKAGAHIKALDDPWLDTTTPHDELILTVMGGMAEFERKLIRQRCGEGIKRVKERGTVFGRKPLLDAGCVLRARRWRSWRANTRWARLPSGARCTDDDHALPAEALVAELTRLGDYNETVGICVSWPSWCSPWPRLSH
jgi:hypothetical protein